MKHTISTLSFAIVLGTAPAVWAGADSDCHFHGNKPAAAATVLNCANQRKAALVGNGKIDKSWQAVKHGKAEVVDGKKGKEWKITFKDAAAKDKSKETLYMFFTPTGNFVAANFTGQ